MLSKGKLQRAPYLKLERAKHHINDLNRCIESFLAEKPFKLMVEVRADACELALRTQVKKAIPAEFSLIIGDAIHNMRSALDVTLYPMARGTAPSPDKIQFPFCKGFNGLEGAINRGQVKFAGKKVVEA